MRTLGGVLLLLFAVAVPAATLDEDFLAAREACTRRAKPPSAGCLRPALQRPRFRAVPGGAWQLNPRLEQAAPAEVRAFLSHYPDTPLAERLRIDWLKALAKNQQWEIFEQEMAGAVNDDLDLTCYALQGRMRGQSHGYPEAGPPALVRRAGPARKLHAAFQCARREGLLSTEDMWTRVRLTLEAGQVGVARRAASYLPAGQAPEAGVLETVFSNPAGFLEQKNLTHRNRAGRETVMFAVHRLARTSPQQAARHWTRLEKGFPAEDRAYVWGMIAYLGAMRHDSDALAWYASAGDLSDLQLAWKVRAALRVRNWNKVLARRRRHDSGQGKQRSRVAVLESTRAERLPGGTPRPELLKPVAANTIFTASSRSRSWASASRFRRGSANRGRMRFVP